MKKLISLLLALLILPALLPGCSQEEKSKQPAPIGSQYWEQYPVLEVGSFSQEPLTVQTWNCGRLEATSYEKNGRN